MKFEKITTIGVSTLLIIGTLLINFYGMGNLLIMICFLWLIVYFMIEATK